MIDQFYFT